MESSTSGLTPLFNDRRASAFCCVLSTPATAAPANPIARPAAPAPILKPALATLPPTFTAVAAAFLIARYLPSVVLSIFINSNCFLILSLSAFKSCLT